MKIVCESCGAKYSIADEKVAGKVFKIRCKKCSEVIVVRGDQQEDEATRVADVGLSAPPPEADAVWHIVINGDQQGPFSPAQIGEMLTAGTVDWEAYVWREGFDNWLPARDVEPLVQAITTGGDAGGSGDTGADPFGESAGAGGGLFGGGGASAFAAEPAPAPAARAARAGGGDLFAQADAGSSPFGGGDDDDGVVASAPSPRVSNQQASLTGQRNENSVLFSLANLQALATGTPGGGGSSGASASSSSGQAKAGMAAGEGSGLIDIRALASAGGLGGGMMGGGSSSSSKKESVDDLLSIGSGGSPFAPTLGAPMLAPAKQEGGNKGVIIGGFVAVMAVVAIAAVVLVVVLGGKDDPAVPPATAIAAVTPPVGTALPVGAAPIAAPPTGTTPPVGTPTTPIAAGGTEPATAAPEEGNSGSARRPSGGVRRPSGGGGGGSTPAATAGGGGTTAPAGGGGGTTARRPSGGSNSIDDLLGQALGPTGGGGRPPAAAAGGGGGGGGDAALPEQPGRDQVRAALSAVQTAVAACGGGQHGMAMTAITVGGSTGRVSNAVVSGQFAGTPVGSCVARAARGARFPRFRNPTFSVSFPFRI